MLYKFDRKNLTYSQVSVKHIHLKYLGLLMSVLLVMMLFQGKSYKIPDNTYSEEEVVIIINNYDTFSEEKLIHEIKRRNFRFPHIIFAQSILETGEFSSDIFKYNNNLFGMKQARIRVNTAITTERGHAYYDNWRESLEDYGYYYSTYLSKIRTEDEYYDYLSQNYAEADHYVDEVKRIINNRNLEKLFDVDEKGI